jgi:hypothetical protein
MFDKMIALVKNCGNAQRKICPDSSYFSNITHAYISVALKPVLQYGNPFCDSPSNEPSLGFRCSSDWLPFDLFMSRSFA